MQDKDEQIQACLEDALKGRIVAPPDGRVAFLEQVLAVTENELAQVKAELNLVQKMGRSECLFEFREEMAYQQQETKL